MTESRTAAGNIHNEPRTSGNPVSKKVITHTHTHTQMRVCQGTLQANRKSSKWPKLEEFNKINTTVLDYNPKYEVNIRVHTDINK